MGLRRRLGHPGASAISELRKNVAVEVTGPVPIKFACPSCERAKMTATNDGGSFRKSEKFGECLHSDIAGPTPDGREGVKYIGLFVDEATGWLGAYALEHKSLIYEAFREHFMYLRTQHDTQVKRLKSDNAMEYKGMKPLLKDLGIVRDPIHPSGNGIAERMVRTVTDRLRAGFR